MIKEIITDKKVIGNIIRRIIYLSLNLALLFFVGYVIFNFMSENKGFDFFKYVTLGGIIRTVLALFLFIILGEILIEYKKRYRG